MEIVTNINMKNDYTIDKFMKKYIGISMSPPIPHKELAGILDNRKLIPAIQQIMARTWRRIPGISNNQKTLIELQNDDFANIVLLNSPKGDKLSLIIMGNMKVIDFLTISYVGSEEMFEEYMKHLNIPMMTVYSNVLLNPE